MIFLTENTAFPSPEYASEEGIVAIGGKLTPHRLMEAYRNGIFPWYNADEPVVWWSPDPRFVLFPEKLHISKNMRKLLRKETYQITHNQHFTEVMKLCASAVRKGQDGTWIQPEMIAAYTELHKLGYAHSVEVWEAGELVGGLYGIRLGRVFCGESMFSKRDNASQYGFIRFLQENPAIELIDCQVYTEYLERLGAEEIPRKDFLNLLHQFS